MQVPFILLGVAGGYDKGTPFYLSRETQTQGDWNPLATNFLKAACLYLLWWVWR
jgi:hypothetical protein